MNKLKVLYKYIVICFIYFVLSFTCYAEKSEIELCIDALFEKDIIITHDPNTLSTYKGYDDAHKAYYKIITSDNGSIEQFKIEVIDRDYSEINFNKMAGFNWFAETYLDKDTHFLNEIRKKTKALDSYYAEKIDLGEWIINVYTAQLENDNVHMSLRFNRDNKVYKDNNHDHSLNDILDSIGVIRNTSDSKTHDVYAKLPYNKRKLDKNIYYNLFKNESGTIYKMQFICYKKGFNFRYQDIPGIKEIISEVTEESNFPCTTLNKQFVNLKKTIESPTKNTLIASSSWTHSGWKIMMHTTRYPKRDEIRIKITIYHI